MRMMKSEERTQCVENVVILFAIILLSSSLVSSRFAETMSPSDLGLKHAPSITHFHFFLHEQTQTANKTEYTVSFPNTTSSNLFGLTAVLDYLLTEENTTTSKKVGQAQGILAVSSQTNNSVTMAMNFVFTEGKYNGSSVAVLGQNNLDITTREMPVVGGTGLFRFSTGYMRTNTTFTSSYYFIFEFELYIYTFLNM